MKTSYSVQKDEKFIKSWERQRKNRLVYAILHSLLLSVFISISLIFINNFEFPKDIVRFMVTATVIFVFNAIVQYYWNYSIQENRYQRLIKKKSLNDISN